MVAAINVTPSACIEATIVAASRSAINVSARRELTPYASDASGSNVANKS